MQYNKLPEDWIAVFDDSGFLLGHIRYGDGSWIFTIVGSKYGYRAASKRSLKKIIEECFE